MKRIDWNEQKNAKLKSERGICFEDVQAALEEYNVLDDVSHPNRLRYAKQRILVIKINNYAYLVPYVEDDEKVFLKTIIPSRRAMKRYIKGEKL